MKIKIETITPVHVGSGEILYKDNDFCVGKDSENYDVIGIIDPHKVLKLIGEEHLDAWVLGIERGRSFADIVKQYWPNATIEDYTSRLIEFSPKDKSNTLKEQLHDGLGRPYLPGSSIKGAIRTAVFATLMTNDANIANWLPSTGKLSSKGLENRMFGDTQRDVFRFLQVGDAIFGELLTSAMMMVNINERSSGNYWDKSKAQLIETLGVEDYSQFELRLNMAGYDLAQHRKGVHNMPACMSSITELFKTINAHTASLVVADMDYWNQRKDDDASGQVENYLNELSRLQGKIKDCGDKGENCILRIGHGSGWNFITGGWARKCNCFKRMIVPKVRPKNFNYVAYDFPKTRRMGVYRNNGDSCVPLGFVKLTQI